MAFDLGDYVDVPTRMAELRDKYPDARLQPLDPAHPYRIETIGTQTFVVYVAACYRTADDPTPGVGTAWEPVPGATPYTKNSEIQNAETSAWGRAIVASLIADAKAGIASQEDVRNRRSEQDDPFVPRTTAPVYATTQQVEPVIAALGAYLEANDYPREWAGGPLPAKIETLEAVVRGDAPAPELWQVEGALALLERLKTPAQTALVGCPHCGAEIDGATNRLQTWDDPTSDEDPPRIIAGCQSCAPPGECPVCRTEISAENPLQGAGCLSCDTF